MYKETNIKKNDMTTVTETSKNYSKEIAATILSQLGGNKFLVMTGSKNLAFDTDEKGNASLQMKLSRNKAGVNALKITLMWDDTYTMKFYKGMMNRKTFEYNVTKEQIFEGVYGDQLQKTFTEVTGLYTSF